MVVALEPRPGIPGAGGPVPVSCGCVPGWPSGAGGPICGGPGGAGTGVSFDGAGEGQCN